MSTGPEPEFILPDRSLVEDAAMGAQSYAIFNYYGKGLIAAVKRRRFQRALALGATVHAHRVIDMGCADGILLPSLAQYYDHVAAVDIDQDFVTRSERLVRAIGLNNVRVYCNADLGVDQLREHLGGGYQMMYLLETLEHIGNLPDIWASKIAFLNDCFALIESGGRIVISVPKMVGMIILLKNLVQRIFGLGHDSLTWRQLLRSAFLKNTDDLEPLWEGHHEGFNHLKLERHLERSFQIHERRESLVSVFYLLGRVH